MTAEYLQAILTQARDETLHYEHLTTKATLQGLVTKADK